MVSLLFGTHSHQPVGNFDHVFEWAYNRSYKPFIDVLERFPEFRMTLHFTGPLMAWIQKHHPEFNERLRSLVERGQVEIVVSGFYEPVLWSIPHADRVDQIKKAVDFVREHFGAEAFGLWLTERVWESDVVRSLIEAGVRYVLVDDFHFMCAGKSHEELHGYYLTEYEGKTLAVFPIDQKLRYLIPFRPIHETMEYLSGLRKYGDVAAIIFDDGEKFGVWPGTFEWVYDKGWLELFIKTITDTEWVKPTTYSEYMGSNPPLGRIYLPSASYFEMSEWSLPAERALEFGDFIHELEQKGLLERFRQFVRGGIWPGFLVKYEESNRMHKKMLYLSMLAREADDDDALDAVHRAQCNDAYWHGVFGGLYLPHLRHAIYENLLDAEKRVAGEGIEVFDLDKDGFDEIVVRNGHLSVQIAPARGGAVVELSSFSHRYNLGDTLKRRFEHYHKGIKVAEKSSQGVASIHEIEKVVDQRTYRHLKYDWHERLNFIEHFLPPNAGINEFQECSFLDMGDFTLGTYNFEVDGDVVRLHRKGVIRRDDSEEEAVITKAFSVDASKLRVDYSVRAQGGLRLGVELNLALPSSDNTGTKFLVDGEFVGNPSQKVIHPSASEIAIHDVSGMKVRVSASERFELWGVPIYTVSQSESGFDLTYQESSFLLIFALDGDVKDFAIELEIS